MRRDSACIVGIAESAALNAGYRHKDGRQVHIMWSARWSEADQLRIG